MNTQYDDIWESFLENCGYDRSEMPKLDELRYSMIKNATRLYNQKAKKYENRIQGEIECDDYMETLNKKLSDTELLIFTYILATVFLKNKYTEFTSIYGVFAKETGMKDYKAQCDARQYVIEMYDNKATQLIEDEIDSFNL